MRSYAAILALAFLPLPFAACADTPDAPPAITLAQVLPTIQPPKEGVAMAVGAEKTTLPEVATLPSSSASLTDCADDFGLIAREFGTVEAIAPPTMVVLNNRPGPPDLSGAISPSAAFRQLAASLTDAQWKLLASEGGIGLSDLDNTQQALWWAIFPGKTLEIIPKTAGLSASREQPTDLSAALPQVRLRLIQKVTLSASRQDGYSISLHSPPTPGAPLPWVIAAAKPKPPAGALHGNLVRAEVANMPKAGDLKFDSPALKAPVPLANLQTVGDLIARIGQATGLEIYADPHYATRSVTLLGPSKTAAARDLLQALALCVAGTYRAVGPAYVLTNDLIGIATTREIWEVYNEGVESLLNQALDKSRLALFHHHAGEQFTSAGDPLALNKDEAVGNQSNPLAKFVTWDFFGKGEPLDKLTPAQQTAARAMLADYAATHAALIAKYPQRAPDPNGMWYAMPVIKAQAVAPGLSQPIELTTVAASDLFWPPTSVATAKLKDAIAWRKQHPEKPKADDKPSPNLAGLIKKFSHRALLAAPRGPDEVKSLVTAMQKLGLNELWLTVFADGQARVPNTPFPQPLDQKDDLLATALTATKGTGITVYPVADLLTWSLSPPADERDLNVLGKNSVEIAARRHRDFSYLSAHPANYKPPQSLWVSPFAPAVSDNLAALVKALAARPGIAGLVWRADSPAGYEKTNDYQPLCDTLGYTEAARLGFLRLRHADPLDIAADTFDGADFSIPTWDIPKLDRKEYADWRKYRLGAENWLLRTLIQAARQSVARPTIFRVASDQYGDIADIRGGPIPPGPLPADGALPAARPNLAVSEFVIVPGQDAGDLAEALKAALSGKSSGGFALDIIPADGGMGAAGLAEFAAR